MSYTEFTLDAAETAFGLTAKPGDLFPGLPPVAVPAWLPESIQRGRAAAALVSGKARSEFLVVPILMAAKEITPGELTIYSGQRLDVDPKRGLSGECDYILARTPPVPRLRAPLLTVVEAKKGDIEAGLGQCAAQMVAVRLFNERAGAAARPIYGCVTTGDVWQFLRLNADELLIDREYRYIDNLGGVLAALVATAA